MLLFTCSCNRISHLVSYVGKKKERPAVDKSVPAVLPPTTTTNNDNNYY